MQTNSGKILTPDSVNWDVIPGIEYTKIQAFKVEVTNLSASTAQIGWGTQLPVLVGTLSGSVFTKHDLSVSPLTWSANVVVNFPKKADVIRFVVDTGSSGSPALTYWNGSSWAAITPTLLTPDLTSTGNEELIFDAPTAWAVGGAVPGWYAIRIATAADLVLSDILAGQRNDIVTNVAATNHQIREYSIQPLECFNSHGLFVYTNQVASANFVSIDYERI